MATNLRLGPTTEAALRAESERTGLSQQQLIRDAIDQYLDVEAGRQRRSLEELYRAGILLPPRPYVHSGAEPLTLPAGMTSADLLDREDRF